MSDKPARPESIPYATPAPSSPRRRLAIVAALAVTALVTAGALLFLARGVTVTVNLAPATAPPATIPVLPPLPPPPPPPPVLALPVDPPRVTVAQRNFETIPGSNDTVLLMLGDISGGRVKLSVLTAGGGGMLVEKTVRPGDMLEFTVGGKQYVVAATRFDLEFIGTDRAEFVVRRAEDPPTGEERIGRLIEAAGKSGAVIVVPPTPSQGAAGVDSAADEESKPLDEYLRDVWLFRKPRSTTPEALAGHAVRPSDAAAASPRVRLRDGREMPLDEWLAAELPKVK